MGLWFPGRAAPQTCVRRDSPEGRFADRVLDLRHLGGGVPAPYSRRTGTRPASLAYDAAAHGYTHGVHGLAKGLYRMRRRIVIVFLAALLANAAGAAAPSAATSTEGIHPGVQTFTGSAQCTANFVFRDAGGTYIGQAAHCASTGGGDEHERLHHRVAAARHPRHGDRRHAPGHARLQLVACDARAQRVRPERLPLQRLRARAAAPRRRRAASTRRCRASAARSASAAPPRARRSTATATRRCASASPSCARSRASSCRPSATAGTASSTRSRPASRATPAAGSSTRRARRSAC